tara:strand:+ start:322 stop:594 length:273 start_codon:yes stop_codon:yes gene_type:complete
MAYKQSGMDFGNKKPGAPKEIPPHIKKLSQTNYKDSKSKSTPNEKTATNYDEHNVGAEQDNPTDGKYCVTCGVIKEDHDATHPFKPNYNK